jgi:hypothetical protein
MMRKTEALAPWRARSTGVQVRALIRGKRKPVGKSRSLGRSACARGRNSARSQTRAKFLTLSPGEQNEPRSQSAGRKLLEAWAPARSPLDQRHAALKSIACEPEPVVIVPRRAEVIKVTRNILNQIAVGLKNFGITACHIDPLA